MPKTGLSHIDKSLSTCKGDAFTETFRILEFHLVIIYYGRYFLLFHFLSTQLRTSI